MSERTEVLALIPARSGSKSVPHKNIRTIGGKPLLAWSVEQALRSKMVSRTIVSTDSELYAGIARQYGAEVPFLRPDSISRDDSTDLEVFLHALEWLRAREGYVPEICLHLRPTYPVREVQMIDEIIAILLRNPDLDAVRSVSEVLHPPFKMWYRSDDGLLSPILNLEHVEEPWNECRQKLPTTYLQTANIDVVRTSTILQEHSMTGTRIYGYVEMGFCDIDTEQDFARASSILEMHSRTGDGTRGASEDVPPKTFCFDIDGVIATLTPDNDYTLAEPRKDIVKLINRLFDAGHQITLHSARGTVTGIDWTEVTVDQMRRWGVKYHELVFGKPAADYYVDDRMISVERLEEYIQQDIHDSSLL